MILLNTKQDKDGVLLLNSEEARWIANDLLRAAEESEDHGAMYEIELMSLSSTDFSSSICVRPKRDGLNDEDL